MLLSNRQASKVRQIARAFLNAMRSHEFDRVWDTLISDESVSFFSATAMPLLLYRRNKIDFLFAKDESHADGVTKSQLLFAAFDQDRDGVRNGLLSGLATGLEKGASTIQDNESYVFADSSGAAILVAIDRLPMFFVRETEQDYKFDLVSWAMFSMAYRASTFYEIASRAEEYGDLKSAIYYFEVVSSLEEAFQIVLNGAQYYLCLPFKSGKEIKKATVDISYVYQLVRPFTEFQRCIVVFITVKPCSQALWNQIKKLRVRFGWTIEVIEHKQLAALLKLNGHLN